MRISLLVLALVFIAGKCEKNPDTESGWKIGVPKIAILTEPLLVEREHNELVTLIISAEGQGESLSLAEIEIEFAPESSVASLSSISALYAGADSGIQRRVLFASVDNPSNSTRFQGNLLIPAGKHCFVLDFRAIPGSDPAGKLRIESITLSFSNGSKARYTADSAVPPIRFGKIVRAVGQDGCDTYRIPGLVTTNAGTLITVYDNRCNNSKDLQEDIDIGMSRSIDSGRTWEPMKVIMDMGEYGGLPQNLNGIGDPSILYDPLNITEMIKDPAWQLLLQGPGRGITLNDGTIVFPAQFKADIGTKALDGGQFTCHSTIVYSKDGGITWNIGTGAKSNTTEAQVVQLSDGSLMLNMRDGRNRKDKGTTNGRAVAVTADSA